MCLSNVDTRAIIINGLFCLITSSKRCMTLSIGMGHATWWPLSKSLSLCTIFTPSHCYWGNYPHAQSLISIHSSSLEDHLRCPFMSRNATHSMIGYPCMSTQSSTELPWPDKDSKMVVQTMAVTWHVLFNDCAVFCIMAVMILTFR